MVSPHLHLRMLTDIYGRSDDFDVIHAHTDVWTLPFAELSDTPTVITMHGRLDIPLVQRLVLDVSGSGAGVDQRAPAAAPGGLPCRLVGHHPQRARSPAHMAARKPARAAISRSSGASARRSVRTSPWRSRPGRAGRCGSPPRSIRPTRSTSRKEQIAPLFEGPRRGLRGRVGRRRQAGLLRRRGGHAVSERLARTVRFGDDRVARRRHYGRRSAPRRRPRGARRRAGAASSATTSRRWSGRWPGWIRSSRRRAANGPASSASRAMCHRYQHAYEMLLDRKGPTATREIAIAAD